MRIGESATAISTQSCARKKHRTREQCQGALAAAAGSLKNPRARMSRCHGPARRPAIVRLDATAPAPTPPAALTPPLLDSAKEHFAREQCQQALAAAARSLKNAQANIAAPRISSTHRNCPAGRDRATTCSSVCGDTASVRPAPASVRHVPASDSAPRPRENPRAVRSRTHAASGTGVR